MTIGNQSCHTPKAVYERVWTYISGEHHQQSDQVLALRTYGYAARVRVRDHVPSQHKHGAYKIP